MAAPEAAPAAPDGGKRESATQIAAWHTKQTAATQADHEGTPASPARDFASLLLVNADAGTGVPPGVATAAPPESTEPVAADTTLPDQLLALLDGSWMKSPAAESFETPSADAALSAWGAANATPGAPTRTAGASIGHRDPAAALAAIAISPQAPATASSAMDTAASAALSADLAATTMDGPAPGFPALTPTVANTPVERAIAAPPVSVPANPQAGFDDGFGARLVWMAEQRLGHAEIRLNPEHLGPIDVRVQVDGTQVSAEFHSGHAVVRQAIEASLPRLRELLEQQGMQLGQADVGERHAGSGQPGRERVDGRAEAGSTASVNSDLSARPLRSRGLLDEYA